MLYSEHFQKVIFSQDFLQKVNQIFILKTNGFFSPLNFEVLLLIAGTICPQPNIFQLHEYLL